MEENKKYKDTKGNIIKVISDDYTGLKRGIVYAQIIDHRTIKISKEQFIKKMKDNIYTAQVFAIWNFDFNKYKPLTL